MTQNRQISYWIQHADFSTKDGAPVSLAEAIEVFSGHDWTNEMDQARQMSESKNHDVCPPGIGYFLVDQEDQLLHICPQSWNSVEISCFYPTERSRKRLFGLISPIQMQVLEEVSSKNFPITKVKDVIALFFERNHHQLLNILKDR